MQIVHIDFPEYEFRHEPQIKDLIVLHHTVSDSYQSVLSWWRRDKGVSRVATAYIIDKDGSIYQLFDDNSWAIHLYVHKPGEDPQLYYNEKRSIGIEFVNEGPLIARMQGSRRSFFFKDRIYPGKVYEAADNYRQMGRYWASYTDNQYRAGAELLNHLCQKQNIPADIIDDLDTGGYKHHRGILSHRNLVRYKTDVSPAFDFDKLKEYMCIK